MNEKFLLNRASYKRIKGFDRDQMQQFIDDIYASAASEAGSAPSASAPSESASKFDSAKLREELSGIKGVGEARLNEIMAVIEKHMGA